jgi:hypothetical protein
MSTLLEQASLIMIPSGYKEDVVYSVIPENGNGDLSFTRASNGTRINSAGLVEVTPWNLLEYSEDFSNGVWNPVNSGVTANTTTAPNGTTTADSLLETTANGEHRFWQRPALISGQDYTFTMYVKQNGRKRFQIKIFDSSSVQASALFDVSTGTIVATNGVSTITSVGDGWYRCSIVATSPTTSIGYTVLDLCTDSYTQSTATESYTGDASKGVYIWGAQLNIGATAKPYFPTTDRLNVPRLTYQNGGGGCPSLLLEKQSTNYMPYSQNISLWYAPADGVTLTSNTTDTVSPDGTNNASKIAIVSGSKRSYEITNSVAGVGTFSAYVKAGTSTSITLFTSSGSINIGYNLSTLAITQTTGTGTITSVGNGWFRITATNTLGASEVLQVLYSGTAGQTIYIWGFQVEASSYVTSYIFTNGASATRVADECRKTGISSLIGQTEGVMFVDFEFKGYDELPKWIAFLGTGSSYIGIYTDNVFRIVAEVANAGTSQFISQSFTFSVNTRYKITIAYKENDFAFYINGTQIATDSSGTVPTTSQFSFEYNTTANNLTSRIYNQAVLFKTRLTNAELASLTTI